MDSYSYIAFIPLLPLVTFVLLGLFGRKYFKNSSGAIGTVSLLAIRHPVSLYSLSLFFY